MIKKINNHVYESFKEQRDNLLSLSFDLDLKRIAIDFSKNFNTNFKASDSWVFNFKKQNKIASLKITKFVTKKQIKNQDQIKSSIEQFKSDFYNISPKYSHESVK